MQLELMRHIEQTRFVQIVANQLQTYRHAAIAKARQDFAGHRVSTRVNNTRNNSPALIEAVAAQTGTVAQAKPPATKRRSASKVDLNNSLF